MVQGSVRKGTLFASKGALSPKNQSLRLELHVCGSRRSDQRLHCSRCEYHRPLPLSESRNSGPANEAEAKEEGTHLYIHCIYSYRNRLDVERRRTPTVPGVELSGDEVEPVALV